MNVKLKCDGWFRLAGGSIVGHFFVFSLEIILRKKKQKQRNKSIICCLMNPRVRILSSNILPKLLKTGIAS